MREACLQQCEFFFFTVSEEDNATKCCKTCLEIEEISEEKKRNTTKLVRTVEYSISCPFTTTYPFLPEA